MSSADYILTIGQPTVWLVETPWLSYVVLPCEDRSLHAPWLKPTPESAPKG